MRREPLFDHVGVEVTDLERSRSFYEAALAPLGISVSMEFREIKKIGLGAGRQGNFWLRESEPVTQRVHVAFAAQSPEEVDAFHAAGLKAGGTDNGMPGLRPIYHETYYGAFLLDPDGNNVEAVFHGELHGN